MMDYKNNFAVILAEELDMSIDVVLRLIEKPKMAEHGDLAFPCFQLAKSLRQSPVKIAEELSGRLQAKKHRQFEKIVPAGGYVNAFLDKTKTTKDVLAKILELKNEFGSLEIGENGTVAIDMSSPNIAKPFSMGHLRSTVIGHSLALILVKAGYKPVKINHLGDWGTQFGKLISAYKKWGCEEKVKKSPIKELLALYVKFHEEASGKPEFEQEGRDWFKRLEDGDTEALQLWKWFKDESLKEFTKIYDALGIQFDSFAGEAFYNDKMDEIVEILKQKNLLEKSDGALVVKLEEDGLPPCLIKKTDGATLYATRDLAAAKYRKEKYGFAKSLYVVGHEQSLHFKQLKAVLNKMGFGWSKDLLHIPFGMMLKDGKKMSTRKGKVVLLEDVLKESIDLAGRNIEEKNPGLETKEEVAKMVGTGAIIFHDLKNHRMNDIEFSLEEMLKAEGETGPYVQYAYVRGQSILRKAGWKEESAEFELAGESEWGIVTELMEFPETVARAAENHDPSQIAKYVLGLAKAFNKYYGEVRILSEHPEKDSRITLVHAVCIVLEESLRLLGMKAPKAM